MRVNALSRRRIATWITASVVVVTVTLSARCQPGFAQPAFAEPASSQPLVPLIDDTAPAPAAPGERGAPTSGAAVLRGAMVPDSLGAQLRFANLRLDLPLSDGDPTARQFFVRARLGLGMSEVPAENRSAVALGNLTTELWLTGAASPRSAWRTSWRLGLALPAGAAIGVEGRIFEQRAEEGVPSFAFWGGGNWTRRGVYWDVMFDVMLGVSRNLDKASWLVISGSATAAFRVTPTLSLPIALVMPSYQLDRATTLSTGVRWRPIPAFEIGAGTYVHIENTANETNNGALPFGALRPTLDVTGRF